MRIRAGHQLGNRSVRGASKSRTRPAKRVRYKQDEDQEKGPESGLIRSKEDIPIPTPLRRRISKAERLIAIVMAPNDGPSRMHGLHGKKLVCVYSGTIRCITSANLAGKIFHKCFCFIRGFPFRL